MRTFISSLRVRLMILVTLALLPILGLILYIYQEERTQAIIEAQKNALNLAKMAAKDQGHIFEEARQLLLLMAQLPSVRNLDAVSCNQFMRDLIKQFPVYENLGLRHQAEIFSAVPFHLFINTTSQTGTGSYAP